MTSRKGIPDIPLELWPTVDVSLLSKEDYAAYSRNSQIIEKFMSGQKTGEICEKYKVSRQWIHYLLKRCLNAHPDGRIYGYRALIPHIQQKQYERTTVVELNPFGKAGASGALGKLFKDYPDIKRRILSVFFKKEKGVIYEPVISFKSAHKRFIDYCREDGIKADEYPFNTKMLGCKALYNFLKKQIDANVEDGVRARYGKRALRNLDGPGAYQPKFPINRPYMRVEFDGHNIDIAFILRVPSPHGGTTDIVINRIWLLIIRDVASTCTLGYHLAFSREYTKEDVKECIKKTIKPWKRRELKLPGLKYHPNGGFPSEVIKALEWAVFQEFCYDNARANLSHEVKRVLKHVTGCAINAGPVKMPERRPLVERFFGLFEENGFHRLPSTLGDSPTDERREEPEDKAQKYGILLEHIEDLVEVLISDFNGTPSSSIGYRTPLEQLKLFVSYDPFIPKLEEGKRGGLIMFGHKYECTIRGNMRKGRRPYIQLEGAIYTNEILATSPGLIGQKVSAYLDPNDPRLITVFFSNGSELGTLQAKGFWGITPHSLQMRKAIIQAKHKRLIHYTESEDPIHIYIDYLNKNISKNRTAKSAYMKHKKAIDEAQKQNPEKAVPPKSTTPAKVLDISKILKQKTVNR